MDYTIWSYTIYLLCSVATTIWVGHTLHRNGRIFLIDAFRKNTELADSVNHLLLVGFYLINIGYVTFAVKYGTKPESASEVFEVCSTKVGLVLLVLGVMHFLNLNIFSKMRKRGLLDDAPPPVAPGRSVPVCNPPK